MQPYEHEIVTHFDTWMIEDELEPYQTRSTFEAVIEHCMISHDCPEHITDKEKIRLAFLCLCELPMTKVNGFLLHRSYLL